MSLDWLSGRRVARAVVFIARLVHQAAKASDSLALSGSVSVTGAWQPRWRGHIISDTPFTHFPSLTAGKHVPHRPGMTESYNPRIN